uniref:N-acetyltransferase domain-containing protein n=1 Tax=Zooxanthella nutricula TaxID=1333877 RepID=A0A6U9LWM9_9DINO
MGACCSGGPAGPADAPQQALEVHRVEAVQPGDKATILSVCDVAARSFAGSKESEGAPEFHWLLTGPGSSNAAAVAERGDPERELRVRACMSFCVHAALLVRKRGLVLCARSDNDQSKVLGCAVLMLYPKGYSKSANGFCFPMRAGMAAGADKWTKGQNEFMNSKRMRALDKVMSKLHHAHGAGPHIYTWVVAVAPEAQGQGVAGRLLRAANAVADAHGLASYLECTGPRNQAVYGKLGYTLAGCADVAVPGDDGVLKEICAMVRQPHKGFCTT